MDKELNFSANYHKCEGCGRRTAKQRDGKWICRACAVDGGGVTNEQRRLGNTDPVYARNKMRSQSDVLAHDTRPIAGIGDSLKELEAKLSAIDADLYFQLNKDEGHAEL